MWHSQASPGLHHAAAPQQAHAYASAHWFTDVVWLIRQIEGLKIARQNDEELLLESIGRERVLAAELEAVRAAHAPQPETDR